MFVANRGYALTNSRRALIMRIISSGRTVVIVTKDDKESRLLREAGVHLEEVVFDRGGFAIVRDTVAFIRLLMIHMRWRPLLVQHFNAKPVILGSIAAWIVQRKRTIVVNTITGLGHAFIKGGATAKIAGAGYGHALHKSAKTIFQNTDDMGLFQRRGWVTQSRSMLISGSGVDKARFMFVDRKNRPDEQQVVILLARLLRQKGIEEFVEVARRVRDQVPGIRFLLAGEEDLVHPDAISADWVNRQQSVEYLGRVADVFPLLQTADILLFPSYREGVPRVILEAAATGLPTVAFDVPGVREALHHGENGLMAPLHDVGTLTGYVRRLIADKTLRMTMGEKARRIVEERFDIRHIERQYLQTYAELGVEIGECNINQ